LISDARDHLDSVIRAILDAARLREPDSHRLISLSAGDWERALDFCDRHQFTLVLGNLPGLPDPVHARICAGHRRNHIRLDRLRTACFEIFDRLDAQGIEYVVLKGIAQCPDYVADLTCRVQYDIDLFCPEHALLSARDALAGLGYEPITHSELPAVDHLPAMVRKTGWEWRGDYLDPDLPPSVDLHFRFWDAATEGFEPGGIDAFWGRRTSRPILGRSIPVLARPDALAYGSLHLVRHLLRGSARLNHVYELARFLHEQSGDDEFWARWRELHPESLRRIEAVAFRLAAAWFDCRLSGAACAEIDHLPDAVHAWFAAYAHAPLDKERRPNKSELWLHLALIESPRVRWKVLARKLVPSQLPGPVDAVHLAGGQLTPRIRVRRAARYAGFLASRALYHGRALIPTLLEGLRWSLRTRGLKAPFWRFLGVSAIFNFALFVYFLLFNLLLLGRGYREDFLGVMTTAMTLGAIAGSLPAAVLIRRFGLQRALIACFSATAALCAVRCFALGRAELLASAFLGGAALSVWTVSIMPAISAVTSERTRARGFSTFFAASIAIGAIAGVVGGRLPSLAGGTQAALLLSCALAAIAGFAGLWLELPRVEVGHQNIYPRNRFFLRYLPALAVWGLATGSFNPFFNAFFATFVHMRVERIGVVFSLSQMGQVLAILLAPVALRRLGLVRGIAGMQWMTAVALGCLSAAPGAAAAAVLYVAYMSFQWMSEPGMNTLVSDQVEDAQRGGASALHMFCLSVSQALAAALGGVAISRLGYRPALAAAAVLAGVAAVLFRVLLRRFDPALRSRPSPRSPRSSPRGIAAR
jgi:predicted MFS family arabinose efflux permease